MSVFKNNTMDAAEFLAKLREVLSYDPDTGLFTWLVQPRRKDNRLGQTAGKVSTTTGLAFDAAVRAHRAPHSATNESLGLI
jgi:hypothetical protein